MPSLSACCAEEITMALKKIPRRMMVDGAVSVRDLGATGDGATDDTAEFQAAWTAAATAGRDLFVPAGDYLLTDALSGGIVTIRGEGAGRTRLIFQNMAGKDGLTFTAPTTYDRAGGVCDLSIIAKTTNGRYGIVTSRDGSAAAYRPKYFFERLSFAGYANAATGAGGGFPQDFSWTWMIDLGDSWMTHISEIDALGTYRIDLDPTAQTLDGFLRMHASNGILSMRLENVTTHNVANGVEIKDRVFWYFNHFDIAQSYKGIYTNRDNATTVYGEGIIQATIVNSQLWGVHLEDRIATTLRHVTCNRDENGFDHGADWYGIRIYDASSQCHMTDIKALCSTTVFSGTIYGIYFKGSASTINQVVLQGVDKGIYLDACTNVHLDNIAFQITGDAFTFANTCLRCTVGSYQSNVSTTPANYFVFSSSNETEVDIPQNYLSMAANDPEFVLKETDAATDEKYWRHYAAGGDFRRAMLNDSRGGTVNFELINRTGLAIDSIEWRATKFIFNQGPQLHTGAGSPEGVITAPIGSVYLNTTGSTSTSLWVKTSGTGNTGWTGK